MQGGSSKDFTYKLIVLFIYYLYNMTCLECLNVTSIVDDRCAELTNSYPYLSDAAPISNSHSASIFKKHNFLQNLGNFLIFGKMSSQ
jgi:hypothetical protein